MLWFLLIVLLLAAAFGVLGVVLKVTAILIFTLVLTTVILVGLGWWIFKRQARRFTSRFGEAGPLYGRPATRRSLPSGHDDRY